MSVFSLAKMDAVDWLVGLPSDSVNLIITDPAYESLEKHRAIGTTTRLKHSDASSNDWFPIFPNSRFPELFRQMYRVLKRDSHLYMFCDQETAFIAKPMAEAAGFKWWHVIVWDKVTLGLGYHYRGRHEFILFFEKGKRKLNDLSIPDILSAARVRGGYSTEKPLSINATLVEQSSQPGELVIDPFVGSGPSLLAAVQRDRNAMGCDVVDKALAITRERLLAAGATEGDPMSDHRGQLALGGTT